MAVKQEAEGNQTTKEDSITSFEQFSSDLLRSSDDEPDGPAFTIGDPHIGTVNHHGAHSEA